jgi:hypothetical protein
MANSLITPLRISPNQRYFIDANGDPFFWLADTAWPLFAQYSQNEAEQYLARRAEQGFNIVKGVLAWPGGTMFEKGFAFPNPNGDVPWLNDNPMTPSEAYFDYVEHVVRFAAEHGLILNMLPIWGYHVNDIKLFDTNSAYAYGYWLGRRFKDFTNVIWALGGDRRPDGFEDIYRAMAYGLRDGHERTQLMTFHPNGAASSARYFHNEDWLDFNLLQTWGFWERIYPAVLSDFARTPIKPIIMDEGAYEDGPEYPQGPITPLLVRRQAWWSFMGGGFHTYGHNNSWRVEPGWISALDAPGAAQITQFKAIATSRRWWELSPCPSLIGEGMSYGKYLNTAMRAQDSNSGILYFSSHCYVLVHTYEIALPRVRATWVNTVSREQQDAGIFERGVHWFSPPDFWEDAVLMLDGFV